MSYKFISAVPFLKVETAGHVAYTENKILTKPEIGVVEQDFGYRSFVEQVGDINMTKFVTTPCLYTWGKFEDLEALFGSSDVDDIMFVLMYWYKISIHTLWYAKDNSCNPTTGFFEVKKLVYPINTGTIVSNAKGEFSTVIFTDDDLDKATAINKKIVEISSLGENNYPSQRANVAEQRADPLNVNRAGSRHLYFGAAQQNRIERANGLLQIARSNSNLIHKIAFYVDTLECIFSTSKDFVNSTIAKRAAKYLGGSSAVRSKNEFKIKTAYDVRSSFFHGSNHQMGRDELADLSVWIDDILRKVMCKVILEDSDIFLDENGLEAWFQALVTTKTKPSETFLSTENHIKVPVWMYNFIKSITLRFGKL